MIHVKENFESQDATGKGRNLYLAKQQSAPPPLPRK
jgi:hypothetical protein